MPSSTISATLTLRLVGANGAVLPLGTELQYTTYDPVAVTALFDTGEDEPIRWVFARDLLTEGLNQRAGEGDIVVWPSVDDDGFKTIHLQLQSPDGDALIEADAEDIERFLAKTSRLVAPGDENLHMDLDRVLVSILDGA